jgi:Domain of unknown function (DUF5664)
MSKPNEPYAVEPCHIGSFCPMNGSPHHHNGAGDPIEGPLPQPHGGIGNLPTDPKARKAAPIWTGVMMYFPAVWAEVCRISVLGNEQHNPGEPLHWARGKSMDQMDAAFRHMLDHGTGNIRDTDGSFHLAKAIWRLCAELQLTIEKEQKA